MTVITLTTDFGTGGHEAGVLKGVIWTIAPAVQIADLSHEVTPQDIIEGALLLWRSAPYFPAGTIHLAVIDPGVGTPRRGIATHIGTQYFVGPDNGLFSMVLARAGENQQRIRVIQLDQPKFWLPEVTSVFHGRDVFAPVAAHLACGTPMDALGTPISDPVRLEIPKPVRTSFGWVGEVIHVDRFGNLSTNLQASHLEGMTDAVIRIKHTQIDGLVAAFGQRPAGTLVALLDSSGSLAISVVNGSAAQHLQASVGDGVELDLKG